MNQYDGIHGPLVRKPGEPKPQPNNLVIAYTDGSCWPNPGPGGWAFRLECPDGTVIEDSGYAEATTNNRMEYHAIYAAILRFGTYENPAVRPTKMKLLIRSDSKVALGWAKQAHKEICLGDQRLFERVTFEYVRGHTGIAGNECVDALAEAARKSLGIKPEPEWYASLDAPTLPDEPAVIRA